MLDVKNEVLVKSQFVQVVRNGDKAIIWHSLFGRPKIVSIDTLELFRVFAEPLSVEDFLTEYDVGEDGEGTIHSLVRDYYLVPDGLDERALLAKLTHERQQTITQEALITKLGLTVTEECNFRCTYCIHFGNLGTSDRINNPHKFMTFAVAKEAVDKYVGILRRHGKIAASINFGGGEPLLNWQVIEQVIAYYRSSYGSDMPCQFGTITNASLITPMVAGKLKEYGIQVSSSIDGLGDINDMVRRSKSGHGTFNAIMAGFQNLMACGCPFDVAVTVSDQNFPFVNEKIIDWAASLHMKHIRINPDMLNIISVPSEELVDWIMRLKKYGHELGVDVTGSWRRPFDNFNDSALDDITSYCAAFRGEGICVSPSKDIYACPYSTNQLGTLERISQLCLPRGCYETSVKEHLVGSRGTCRGCIIEGQCAGGCGISREFSRTSKSKRIFHRCKFYRRMTKELLLEQLS